MIVDPIPTARIRYLDRSLSFHAVIDPADREPVNLIVRRLAPKREARPA